MKSKIVKRVLAASLATAMVAGMAGCGNDAQTNGDASSSSADNTSAADASTDASADASSEEEVGQYTVITDENGNPVDLGGIEVIIRDWWSGDGERTEAADAYEEARYEYLDWIQETYNFTIKEMTISSWASVPEDFANYATTGGDEYYVFTLRQGSELTAAMNSGLMYDVSKLDCLDFSEEKWSSGVHKMFSKDGAIYGFRGIAAEPKGGMYFNKRLLQEAGIDPQTLYDYQENGEWTWDKFEEVCQQVQADTDNDGVIDRYAMANFTSVFYPLAVYSNGGDFIAMDESGKYYNDLESEETMEALNWAFDMLQKYEMVYPEDAAWDYWITAYVNGEACFTADECYRAGQFNTNGMEDDFGFVCFPKGPKASDYTNIYADNVYAIPACYDDEKAWKIAFAYNLYTDPVPGFEDFETWKSGYYQNFRDTEAVDLTIARLVKNGRVTYHTLISGLDLGPDLFWAINKDNTPAQQAEAIRNTWAAYLEEANK